MSKKIENVPITLTLPTLKLKSNNMFNTIKRAAARMMAGQQAVMQRRSDWMKIKPGFIKVLQEIASELNSKTVSKSQYFVQELTDPDEDGILTHDLPVIELRSRDVSTGIRYLNIKHKERVVIESGLAIQFMQSIPGFVHVRLLLPQITLNPTNSKPENILVVSNVASLKSSMMVRSIVVHCIDKAMKYSFIGVDKPEGVLSQSLADLCWLKA